MLYFNFTQDTVRLQLSINSKHTTYNFKCMEHLKQIR